MNKSFFLCFFISITRSTCKYRQKTIFIIAAIVTFQHGIRSYNTIKFFFFFYLWGIWRLAPPLIPWFLSCWRRGKWQRSWTWQRPLHLGPSPVLCLRTVHTGKPTRWSEWTREPGAAPAGLCSSVQSVHCDSPRLQPETPETTVHGHPAVL